ncbi:MAG: MCE family protein [Deltaproteobacteria bacterium]|nr:MCE family protein [Deltaproteobacteria bacterium]
MNLTKAEKIRLGAFVGTSVAILAGTLIVLAGLKVWERRDEYTVLFTDNVGGLEPSAQVKFQGLRVGRVERMRISPEQPGAVEVTIALDRGTVLRKGTKAVMEQSILTGFKTINLSAGDPRGEVIPPGSQIPAAQSLFDKITGQAEQISEKIELVANQLARLASDENRARFENMLDNVNKLATDVDTLVVDVRGPLIGALEEVDKTGEALRGTALATTKTLDDVRADLVGTLANTRGTLAELKRILAAIDSKQVSDAVTSANSAMKSLDARLSSAELGKTIDQLGTTLADLSRILADLELTARSGREDFVMSLKAIREASEALREFSRIIAQDPSVLIRGTEAQE